MMADLTYADGNTSGGITYFGSPRNINGSNAEAPRTEPSDSSPVTFSWTKYHDLRCPALLHPIAATKMLRQP